MIWRVVESAQVGGLTNLRAVAALSGSGKREKGQFGKNQGVKMVSKEISFRNIISDEISVNLCPTFHLLSTFGGTTTPLTIQQFPFSICKTTLRFKKSIGHI